MIPVCGKRELNFYVENHSWIKLLKQLSGSIKTPKVHLLNSLYNIKPSLATFCKNEL